MSRRPVVRSHSLMDYTEADLIKLQHQYRRADRAKRAYTDHIRGLIFRDKRMIQRLQDERAGLLCSLGVSSGSEDWTDVSAAQDLSAMLSCGDRIEEEVEAEKAKVAYLGDQISKWERKLKGQRTGQGSTQMKTNSRSLLKTTSLRENRLQRGRKCFNELMTRNKELREELKILQLEKKHFHHVQSQLVKELHELRKGISKLTTKCTEAFNVSEKLQEKQRMLKGESAKDVAQYIKKRRCLEQELSRQCHYDVFVHTKAITRRNQNIDDRKAEKCKPVESFGFEDFKNVMKEIYREMGESDLDKLLRDFIQREEQSYSLLECINYPQTEAETIQKQISQLRKEREAFVSEKQQQQEEHLSRRMRVSIKQDAAEQQLAVCQQRVGFLEKLLDRLKKGVTSMLQISHDSSVICCKLGTSEGGQEENITDCLRMLEERVSELLTLQSYLHYQEDYSQWDIDGINTIAGQLLGITPPAATRTTDDDPDLVESVLLQAKERMSRDDLLTLVNKRAQMRKKTD